MTYLGKWWDKTVIIMFTSAFQSGLEVKSCLCDCGWSVCQLLGALCGLFIQLLFSRILCIMQSDPKMQIWCIALWALIDWKEVYTFNGWGSRLCGQNSSYGLELFGLFPPAAVLRHPLLKSSWERGPQWEAGDHYNLPILARVKVLSASKRKDPTHVYKEDVCDTHCQSWTDVCYTHCQSWTLCIG